MSTAAAASTLALAARGSSALRGSAAPLPAHAPRQTRRRAAAPARAGLFDGLFGKPADKPAKPGKAGGMKPVSGSCKACSNKGGVTCKGCAGSGKNKKNGNPFEHYKCYDCQARGLAAGLGAGCVRQHHASPAIRLAHARRI